MMENSEDKIQSSYKEFQEKIRSFQLLESLYVVWCYSRNYTFDFPFPNDIEIPNGFDPTGTLFERRYNGLPEFEQEFLVKEILINCQLKPTASSLRLVKELSGLINYLRHTLLNRIDQECSTDDDFYIEFNRMVHRQFGWQIGFNKHIILRYYKIYSASGIDELIVETFGYSTLQFFFITFFFFKQTARIFKLPLPVFSNCRVATDKMLEDYINRFSLSLDEAATELRKYHSVDKDLIYTYNPLLSKPFLIYDNSVICPIHLHVSGLIPNGLYYNLINKNGFDNAYGDSFQEYIGQVLKQTCDKSKISIVPEDTYGKEEKRTVDWVIYDHESIVFLECKTKRLTLLSKTELDIERGLLKDLDKMASFIIQVYKTYNDYKAGLYKKIEFDSNKLFIPVIITLEDWYINFNHKIMDKLKILVIEKMLESEINPEILDSNPYFIFSCEEFEGDIQIIDAYGIREYFSRYQNNRLWEIKNDFKYKEIFKGDFDRIFMASLNQG